MFYTFTYNAMLIIVLRDNVWTYNKLYILCKYVCFFYIGFYFLNDNPDQQMILHIGSIDRPRFRKQGHISLILIGYTIIGS